MDHPTEKPVRDDGSPPWCISIDVEEYFHIEAARGYVHRDTWDDWPPRVESNVELLLNILDRYARRATFFILGAVAQRYPGLIKRIAAAGHEIACHGTSHDRLHRLDPAAFREDVLACKKLLEDQTGKPVIGYRAPTFSVVPRTAWSIDVLVNAGFAYDASIFPVRHPWYGVPGAPLEPFHVQNGRDGPPLLEVPPLVWEIFSKKLGVAGGGYFRLLPLAFMRRGLAQARRRGRPAVLYFHPWEFDHEMPRMPLSWIGRLRTYTGLKSAASRLDRIMRLPGHWTAIADVLSELRDAAQRRPVFDLAERAPKVAAAERR